MIFFVQIMVVLSVLIFLVGLIKPKWILFWMKEPDRLWASTLGLLLFMGSVTAYSELRLKHKPRHPQREALQERSEDRRNELQLDR